MLLCILAYLLVSQHAMANGGIGYKGMKLNLNGSSSWYNVHGVTWGYQGCGDYGSTFYNGGASNWNGINLGSFGSSATLQITGYAVVGWTDNTDYVAGKLEYKVWKVGDAEPGTWNVIYVGNYQSPTSGATQVVCSSGNDRIVGYNDGTTSFQPGVAGTYNFKLKAFGRVQYTGGGGGSFNANDGTEMTATFTIVAAPAITSTSSSVTSNNTQTYRGATLTINGTNLSSVNAVKIGGSGGASCTGVTVVSASQVTAVVPDGTTGGTIWISDGSNTATSTDSYSNLGFRTNATGNWNTGATWLGSTVPASGVAVTVASGHTLTLDVGATVSSLTVNSGGTFNNGTAQTLTISASGTLANSGTFTGNTGTVSFAGAGTVSGTVAFNNVTLAGGVNFGTASTVNGNLTLNAGGFVNTNAPVYGASSTLIYNTGGTYGRSNEWSSTTGAGYPNNITLQNNTTLNVVNAVNSYKKAAGNLTVNAGSTFAVSDLTIGSGDLGVEFMGNIINDGTISLNGGSNSTSKRLKAASLTNGNSNSTATVNLSGAIGGDLELTGNYTDNANFSANARAVFFTGGSTQLISGTATAPFNIDYIVLAKSGGIVQLNTALLTGAPNGGNGITLTSASDILVLNGNTLTLGTASQTCTVSGSGFIRGSSTSSMIINGTGALGTLNFESGNRSLANLTINRTGTGAAVTLGTDLAVGTALTLTSGALNIGSTSLSIGGSISRTSGTIGASSGTVVFNGSSAQTFSSAAFTSAAINNLTINNTAGVSMSSAITVSGTLNLQSGALSTGSNILTLPGTLTRTSGTISTSTTGTVVFNGSSAQSIPASAFTSGAINNLTINNAAGVSVGSSLTVGATLTLTSGNLSIGSNTLTLNGTVSRTSGNLAGGNSSNLSIGGAAGSLFFASGGTNNFLRSLTIGASGSATLGNALNITAYDGSAEGVVTVTSGGSLNANGFLTLKSSASGTARVAQGSTSGGYITGDVTVERFIPQNSSKAWRLLASNTSGQTINQAWQEGGVGPLSNPNPGFGTQLFGGFAVYGNAAAAQAAGYDSISQRPSLYRYDPTTDNLLAVGATTSTNFNSEQGYFIYIRGDRSPYQFGAGAPTTSTVLRSKGTLFTGNQSAVSTGSQNWGLVRNPYPSRIDMRQIVRSGSLIDAYQVWDPKIGGSFGVGGYQTFTKNIVSGNYEVSPGGGSYGSNGSEHNFIESGHAFFIQSSGGSGSAQVVEAAKVSGSAVSFRPTQPLVVNERVLFNLYASNGGANDMVDGGYADFDNLFSDAVDAYDVRKSPNFSENFGLVRDNISLAVERRQRINLDDTLFFSMSSLRQIQYRLDIHAENIDPVVTSAFLEDKFTGSRTPVSMSGDVTPYTFSVTSAAASRAADRFRLVFRQSGVVPVNIVSVKAIQVNRDIQVQWKVANQQHVRVYEVEKSTDGRQFTKMGEQLAALTETYNLTDAAVASGTYFYRIRAVDQNGTFRYSSVVKVVVGSGKAGITVSPNPLTGNFVNLQFSNMEAGKYGIRLINMTGQTVYKRELQHAGGSASESFVLPSGIPGGQYQLDVVTPGNVHEVHPVIIQ